MDGKYQNVQFPQVVELNVGGRHLTTSLATLTKFPDSMLAAMFSGRHSVAKDKDGRYFIDVDGDVFVYILNFLRLEILPPPEKAKEVKTHAEYLGIEKLSQLCSEPENMKSGTDDRVALQDDLFVHWASNFPNYSKYLDCLRTGLRDCEIKTGYIYVQLSRQQCESRHCAHYSGLPGCRHTSKLHPYYSIIDVPIDNIDDEKKDTLFTVLVHALKKLGFDLCSPENVTHCCCRFVKLFKIDFLTY